MDDIVSTRRLGTFLTQLEALFATKTENGGKASKVTGATAGNFASLTLGGDLVDSGKNLSDFGSAADVAAIEGKIPTQASPGNLLADKAFVNSTVQTGTANYRDSWANFAEVPTEVSSYPVDYLGGKTPTPNDYMVVLDCSAPEWVYGRGYLAGEISKVTGHLGPEGLFRCIDDISESNTTPGDDPDRWEQLPQAWFDVLSAGGTWRFKYSGNWAQNGINGWRPEYQVNKKPLTAAQMAALNSNITSELVAKVIEAIGASGKLLGTASLGLTSGEKEQARTNIGATAPEVFIATYGSTTYAEVSAAYNAGKMVFCIDSTNISMMTSIDGTSALFYRCVNEWAAVTRLLASNSSWQRLLSYKPQSKQNLVTSISPSDTNDQYPGAKAVYDLVKALADANNLTMP